MLGWTQARSESPRLGWAIPWQLGLCLNFWPPCCRRTALRSTHLTHLLKRCWWRPVCSDTPASGSGLSPAVSFGQTEEPGFADPVILVDLCVSRGAVLFHWGMLGQPYERPGTSCCGTNTGNAFLGMKHEGGHMLVRQRNLRVRNGAFARVDKASGRNAVVAAAGVSSASGTLAIQCLLRIGDRVRSLRLRIPRGGITSALRNGLPLFYNASVCSKSKCTHIVGIECCGVDFHLARPILTYVENASRKGDQHAVP